MSLILFLFRFWYMREVASHLWNTNEVFNLLLFCNVLQHSFLFQAQKKLYSEHWLISFYCKSSFHKKGLHLKAVMGFVLWRTQIQKHIQKDPQSSKQMKMNLIYRLKVWKIHMRWRFLWHFLSQMITVFLSKLNWEIMRDPILPQAM